MDLIKIAQETIKTELKEGEKLLERIDDNFVKVVKVILKCRGKIIITGVGKSGLIGRKIAASLSSVGISSFFVHPAEARHGDLGMITKKDIIIAISYSGETEEVMGIIPTIRKIGAKIISLVGNSNSTLARNSDFILDISVKREADPLGIIATSSTTLTLILGDALVSALIAARNFKKDDFVFLHPGGSIGKKFLKVQELMRTDEKIPHLKEDDNFSQALFEITSKKVGAVIIINNKNHPRGIVTDGDVRRLVQASSPNLNNLFARKVKDVMTNNPKIIYQTSYAKEAVEMMEKFSITVLPVVNKNNNLVGIIHLHDLVSAGFTLEMER